MKIEKRWVISFIMISIVCITGAFWPAMTENSYVLSEFGTTDHIFPADVAWMLTSSCLVLIMTPGLSFFYGGMVSKKNVISTMLQSFICMGVITIFWVVAGFSFAFGDSLGGIIGDPSSFFLMRNVTSGKPWPLAPTIPLVLFAFYQL